MLKTGPRVGSLPSRVGVAEDQDQLRKFLRLGITREFASVFSVGVGWDIYIGSRILLRYDVVLSYLSKDEHPSNRLDETRSHHGSNTRINSCSRQSGSYGRRAGETRDIQRGQGADVRRGATL